MLNVFNIQRFSIHDGRGIRTNIFFKGCPLRCLWCNNPESIDPLPTLMFDERLCKRFEDCVKAGKGQIAISEKNLIIDRENISDISALRNVCPSKALAVVGQEMSVAQIINEIEKDMAFYNMSAGGVTLSGGEPLFQGPELVGLITEIKKRGIHVSVETSLHLPWETIEKYIDLIDVFLADLKHMDAGKLLKYTGGDVELVLNNFNRLDRSGNTFVVRVPVIPGFNFPGSELTDIIDFTSGLKNAGEIDFIPYHSLAREKYYMLGKDYTFGDHKNVEKAELEQFIDYALLKGLKARILN